MRKRPLFVLCAFQSAEIRTDGKEPNANPLTYSKNFFSTCYFLECYIRKTKVFALKSFSVLSTMRDNTLEAQESMLRRKEKKTQAFSRQKWEEKGAVITVTGLHCATYIDAEKKPRQLGPKFQKSGIQCWNQVIQGLGNHRPGTIRSKYLNTAKFLPESLLSPRRDRPI